MIWELKQEGRAQPSSTLAGNMHIQWLRFFSILHTSVKERDGAVSGDLGITNTV